MKLRDRLAKFIGTKALALSPISGRGGWRPMIGESFTGAWQRNIEVRAQDVLGFSAVFACVTLIASDIGKLRIKLVEQDDDGIWNEVESPAFSPVLKKPNRYQTRIQWLENWTHSILINGNTYILKERDRRGVVVAHYVLDPTSVTVLVAPDGSVWYAVKRDDLAGVSDIDSATPIPASEIMHDRINALYHPLCGLSPITACGLAALQGLRVQGYSQDFFERGSVPSGVLTSPGVVTDQTAKRLQAFWESQFTGENVGRTAVLGDGLHYEQMTMSAVDAQLIEQLKWTAENVCQAFHVPGYKVGVGSAPTYNNIEALNQEYYSQTLQSRIESIELLLDEGLGLDQVSDKTLGTELDLDDLLRMDTPSRIKAAADAIGSGAVTPNEARFRWLDLGPVAGGDSCYLQQQEYSLEALAKRDAQDNPFQNARTAPAPVGDLTPSEADMSEADAEKMLAIELRKSFELVTT